MTTTPTTTVTATAADPILAVDLEKYKSVAGPALVEGWPTVAFTPTAHPARTMGPARRPATDRGSMGLTPNTPAA